MSESDVETSSTTVIPVLNPMHSFPECGYGRFNGLAHNLKIWTVSLDPQVLLMCSLTPPPPPPHSHSVKQWIGMEMGVSVVPLVSVLQTCSSWTSVFNSVVQSSPHKGDSDKRELLFMGTGFWGQLHACYFYLLNGTALRIKGTFFFLKVYFYIISSSQNLFHGNKCYVWQPSESCFSPCSLDSCCFMFCFGCLRVLLSLAKNTDT